MMLEKFVDSIKINYSGGVVDVFVNPDPKELREINADNTMRWVADLDDKKIYVWNGELSIHRPVINKLQKDHGLLQGLSTSNSEKDIINETGFDRYIQGLTDTVNLKHLNTYVDLLDFVLEDSAVRMYDDTTAKTLLTKLMNIYEKDLSWMDRYGVSSSKIKDTIGNGIKAVHKQL